MTPFGLFDPLPAGHYFTPTTMSLAIDYSSDEEELTKNAATDAFGLSSLPSTKKARVDEGPSMLAAQATAAPDVLSEVSISPSVQFVFVLKDHVGSPESQISGDKAYGYPNEREYPL